MSSQTSSVTNTRKRFAVSPQSDITATMQAMLDKSTTEMKTFITEKLDLKMEDLRLDIDKLAVENIELRARNQINEGRKSRLEKVVSDLREYLLQDNRRPVRNNLIFSHIPVSQEENNS